MSDLISRQDAIDAVAKALKGTFVEYEDIAEKIINKIPSAQPEVICCKDCKWFGNIGCAISIVDDSDKPTGNDFCSFAERRTDETD